MLPPDLWSLSQNHGNRVCIPTQVTVLDCLLCKTSFKGVTWPLGDWQRPASPPGFHTLSLTHLRLCIYVVTDHQALMTIFGSSQFTETLCSEWWGLQYLHGYDYKTVHGSEKENNPADYISMHPLEDQREAPSAVEEFINFVGTQAVWKALTLLEIEQVIKTDKTWNGLMGPRTNVAED